MAARGRNFNGNTAPVRPSTRESPGEPSTRSDDRPGLAPAIRLRDRAEVIGVAAPRPLLAAKRSIEAASMSASLVAAAVVARKPL